MKKQLHIIYTGRVQGVGFRYTVLEIARDVQVTGWVKNMSNGGVELVAEASEEVLKDFLLRINHYFNSYIQDTDVQWLPATGEFKTFDIKFY